MEKPEISRPTYLSGGSSSIEREVERYEADAYRERTFEEGKRAHADRLSETRIRAVELAFRMYKEDPHIFGFDEVLALADRIVSYAREGNQPQDGTSDLRFFGRK